MTESVFEIILIGDSGNISRYKPDPVLSLLTAHLQTPNPSAVIFFG